MPSQPMSWREFLQESYWGNTVQDYLGAFFLFLILVIGLTVLKQFIIKQVHAWALRTRTDLDDFLVGLLQRIGMPVFALLALYVATRSLTLSGGVDRVINAAFVIGMTWTGVRLLERTILFFLTRTYGKLEEQDRTAAAAVKNLTLIARIGLWVGGALIVLDNLGIQITGILAGLGIGGIAIALAAQAILGDAFNSFAIYMDRPFEVGDFIIVDDMLGTVEHVGFKTTRIRSLHGEQLVFANSDLTQSRIRNYKRMRERRVLFTLGVVYQTPVETMKRIPGMIREIIEGVEGTRFDRAHFKAFGDFSLNIEVVYYVLSPDYNRYMDIQQEINFRIMEAFQREGIEFAYPTQTLYLAREEC